MNIETRKKGPFILTVDENCAGCLICQLRCSLRFERTFNPSKARILIRRLVGSGTEYSIIFTEECDNCGICARNCPYQALIQDKRKR